MAAKDNQTYQLVAVSAFIVAVLCLGLTVFLYTSYSKEYDAKTEAAAARTTAETALGEAQGELNRIRDLLGLSGSGSGVADVEAKRLEYAAKAGLAGDGVEEVKFDAIFENLYNSRVQAQAVQLKEVDRANQLEADKKAQFEQFQTKEQELLDKVAQAEADRAKVAEDLQKERERINAEKDLLQSAFDEQDAEAKQKISDLTTQLADTTSDYENLQLQLQQLRDAIDLERPANLDSVDGAVVRVFPRETLWVNVGRADGLQPRTTFSVYPSGSFNAPGAQIKGKIEVVKIIDDKLAECRIIDEELAFPIQRADEIYSPVWAPGRKERFAITGFIDFNGDGASDLSQLMTLIRRNGGAVDAYVGDDGSFAADSGPEKMSAQTSYLIVGQDPSEVEDLANSRAHIDNNSKMREGARALSIRVIPLDRFLDQLGYRPDLREIRYDSTPTGPAPAAAVGSGRRTRYARPF